MRGIMFMAFGQEAHAAANEAIKSLRCVSDMPYIIVGDGKGDVQWTGEHPWGPTCGGTRFLAGRVKPFLHELSPFDETIYADADMVFLRDPGEAFALMGEYEFAVAIAGDRSRWLRDSCFTPQERLDTIAYFEMGTFEQGAGKEDTGDRLGHLPYLNSGLLFWRKTPGTQRLFAAWYEEWTRYAEWDEQVSLQRAIFRTKPLWRLLPDTWNTNDRRVVVYALHDYGTGRARSAVREKPQVTPRKAVQRLLNTLNRPITMDVGSGFNPRPADIYLDKYADNRSRMADLKVPVGKPLVWGDVENLWQFPDKTVDFIHCHHVIEHIANPEAACRELQRVGIAGHLTAPSEDEERRYVARGIKNYHVWLVKQHGQHLRFYPRERVAGLPLMDNAHAQVDLHWSAEQPFTCEVCRE